MIALPKPSLFTLSSFIKVPVVGLLILLVACTGKENPESIINKSVKVHGGKVLENVFLSFDFRDRTYTMQRKKGEFKYERIFQDSLGEVIDVLTNDGFSRLVNGKPVALDAEDSSKYANSVNAVIYLALLPYSLNDEAVNKKYLGETHINGEPYYEIMVTFDEQGGGEDYEDVYMFWINQEYYSMDYFAYAFHTNNGGTRFREAVNPRKVNGVRLADYINYTYLGDSVGLDTYETLFEKKALEEVSKIIIENIEVRHL